MNLEIWRKKILISGLHRYAEEKTQHQTIPTCTFGYIFYDFNMQNGLSVTSHFTKCVNVYV